VPEAVPGHRKFTHRAAEARSACLTRIVDRLIMGHHRRILWNQRSEAAYAAGCPSPGMGIGTLLPGGGANLRMLKRLGGGSDPPSKKFTPLGGGV
jgi:hypothetical protein